jgi:peptidoglycan hydrolase CwlO-like protein
MDFVEHLGYQYLTDLLTEIRVGQQGLEEQMADLTTEVANLREAVSGVSARVDALVGPLTDAVREAQDALATERQAAADLAAAEDAEDVAQNQALADAQAATDAALANAQQAADEINAETARLNSIAQPAEEPTPEQPTEPTPDEPSGPSVQL